MRSGEGGARKLFRSMLPVLLILVRFVVMGQCAVVLTILISKMSDAMLPFSTSFDQTFGRLGMSAGAGVAAGVALGGLLTYGLGRGTYSPDIRFGFAFVAAAPFLILAGSIVLSR